MRWVLRRAQKGQGGGTGVKVATEAGIGGRIAGEDRCRGKETGWGAWAIEKVMFSCGFPYDGWWWWWFKLHY